MRNTELVKKIADIDKHINALTTGDKEGIQEFKNQYPNMANLTNNEIIIALLQGIQSSYIEELEK